MSKPVPDNDPSELLLLFEVESCIVRCDRAAKAAGISINDSQVRSILTKVRAVLEGGKPKLPDSSERDRLLTSLHAKILESRAASPGDRNEIVGEMPASAWVAAVRQVEDSIRRRSVGPGSRAYLDFVADFMARELP